MRRGGWRGAALIADQDATVSRSKGGLVILLLLLLLLLLTCHDEVQDPRVHFAAGELQRDKRWNELEEYCYYVLLLVLVIILIRSLINNT